MPKFRKKPVVIEAVQLCLRNWSQICDFLGPIISEDNPGRFQEPANPGHEFDFIELTIPTLEGNMIAKDGDWIIKGVKGEFYPCKTEIFEATFEPVDPYGRGEVSQSTEEF